MKLFYLSVTAAALTALSIGAAHTCQDKSDCSGSEICCFGSFQADSGGTFGTAQKEGYCTTADICQRESGAVVIYGEGSECPEGTSIKTITNSKGTEVTGCFP